METNTFNVAISIITESADKYLYLWENISESLTPAGFADLLVEELQSILGSEFSYISEYDIVTSKGVDIKYLEVAGKHLNYLLEDK